MNGQRFIDPCSPTDDHNHHWRTLSNGDLEPLTPAGEYTIEQLKLWRPFLQHHRAKTLLLQEEARMLEDRLTTKRLSTPRRSLLETRLRDITQRLEPPIFDRPPGTEHPD